MKARGAMQLLAAIVLATWFSTTWSVGQEVPKPAELAILDSLVGKWESREAIQVEDALPKNRETIASMMYEWTLGGWYLQGRCTNSVGKETFLELLTYDVEKKVYRLWFFGSHGQFAEWNGTWNAASNTLSMKCDVAKGWHDTLTAHLQDKSTMIWRMESKRPSGMLDFSSETKMTRK